MFLVENILSVTDAYQKMEQDTLQMRRVLVICFVALIILISLVEVIYRVIKKKKSAILWVVIGGFGACLPTLLNSPILMAMLQELLTSSALIGLSTILFIVGISAGCKLLYDSMVRQLDGEK